MLKAKWICDICGTEATTPPPLSDKNLPSRWGLLRVEAGGSSASREESKHLCLSCVGGLGETGEKKK